MISQLNIIKFINRNILNPMNKKLQINKRLQQIQSMILKLSENTSNLQEQSNSLISKSSYIQSILQNIITSTSKSNTYNLPLMQSKGFNIKANNNQSHISKVLEIVKKLENNTLGNFQTLKQAFQINSKQLENKCNKMQTNIMMILKDTQQVIDNLILRDRQNKIEIQTLQNKLKTISINMQQNFNTAFKNIQIKINSQLTSFQQDQSDKLQIISNSTSTQIKKCIQRHHQQQQMKLNSKLILINNQLAQQSKIFKDLSKNKSSYEQSSELNKKVKDLTKKIISNQFVDLEQKISNKMNQKLNQLFQNLRKQQYSNKQRTQISNGKNSSINKYNKYNQTKEIIGNQSGSWQKSDEMYQSSQSFTKNRNQLRHQKQAAQFNSSQQESARPKQIVRGVAELRNLRSRGQKPNPFNRPLNTEISKLPLQPAVFNPHRHLSQQKNLSKKSLPPLGMEKVQKQQVQNTDQEDQVYVDEEGYLMDQQGNRLLNDDGQFLQITQEDLHQLTMQK